MTFDAKGNLEGESGNLSDVTEGFSPGTPALLKYSDKWKNCLIFEYQNCMGLSKYWQV